MFRDVTGDGCLLIEATTKTQDYAWWRPRCAKPGALRLGSSALVTFQFHGYYGKSMGKTTMNHRPITLKSALAHFFLRFPQILIKKWNQPARIKEKNGNTAGAAAVLSWVRLIFVGKPYN